MIKRVYLPHRFDSKTMREEPARFVGYTGDGHVVFTEAGRALVSKPEMTHDEGLDLWRELITAASDAKRAADKAAGHEDWVALPRSDGRYTVHYGGHAAIFRPIVNSQRRRGGPGVRVRDGHICTHCRREAPQGATMYVLDESTIDRKKYDPEASALRGYRVCEPCTRPDLHAAVTGLSLIASEAKGSS